VDATHQGMTGEEDRPYRPRGICRTGAPTPARRHNWIPASITPAEEAEAECLVSPAVAEARKVLTWGRFGRGLSERDPILVAMEACIALKGFKRS
jgi:hypothetical protein